MKHAQNNTRAFTLIEILIATAIFATVLIAMNTVFHGALRLRKTTSKIVEQAIPINHAISVIKRDLRSALGPGGVLAGSIMGGYQGGSFGPISSVSGSALSFLEFHTTTGANDDSRVFNVQNDFDRRSEMQRVTYFLREPVYSTNLAGMELVRSITRNLLAVNEFQEPPDELPMMDSVENLEFLFYDGEMWQESWDSTVDTNSVLKAVKVYIEFAAINRDERLRKAPLQIVVPIVAQASTNQVDTAESDGQPQDAGGDGGDGDGGNGGGGGGNANGQQQGQGQNAGGGGQGAGGGNQGAGGGR